MNSTSLLSLMSATVLNSSKMLSQGEGDGSADRRACSASLRTPVLLDSQYLHKKLGVGIRTYNSGAGEVEKGASLGLAG